jgi:hypothetical protein
MRSRSASIVGIQFRMMMMFIGALMGAVLRAV